VSQLIEAEVWQHVASGVPGRVGNWSYSTVMPFVSLPRQDEWIVLAGGSAVRVKDVFHHPGGTWPVHLELYPVSTDNPDELDELAARRWTQHAGPWKDQGG